MFFYGWLPCRVHLKFMCCPLHTFPYDKSYEVVEVCFFKIIAIYNFCIDSQIIVKSDKDTQ